MGYVLCLRIGQVNSYVIVDINVLVRGNIWKPETISFRKSWSFPGGSWLQFSNKSMALVIVFQLHQSHGIDDRVLGLFRRFADLAAGAADRGSSNSFGTGGLSRCWGHGGFHGHGGAPIAGWFVRKNP